MSANQTKQDVVTVVVMIQSKTTNKNNAIPLDSLFNWTLRRGVNWFTFQVRDI